MAEGTSTIATDTFATTTTGQVVREELECFTKKEIISDWAQLSGTLRKANSGKGNFGIGSATREQADVMGKAWVGDGYKISGNGNIWISANGMRQYRPPFYKPRLNKFQANYQRKFEGQISKEWQANAHLNIIE